MRNAFLLTILLGLLNACDDGDFTINSFDFNEAPLSFCETQANLLFFKINSTSAESFALETGLNSSFFLETDTVTVALDGNNAKAIYRNYAAAITPNYFCNTVPPTTPQVLESLEAIAGQATIINTAFFDDNDGIDLELPDDLDQDGIPNFYDFDDDGDNVPTAIEVGNDPNNPQDTDEDGIPDYLDTDDDNDGVLTRNEDLNQNLNPTDDVSNPLIGPDYLNADVSKNTPINAYRDHLFTLTSFVRIDFLNMLLTDGTQELLIESLIFENEAPLLQTQITINPVF